MSLCSNLPKRQLLPVRLSETRHAGVSDAVWAELECAKAEHRSRQQEYDAQVAAAAETAHQAQLEYEDALREEAERQKRLQEEADAKKRALYEKKLREAQAALDAAKRELERQQWEQNKLHQARQAEQFVQARLQRVGNCVAGFQWIKMAGGYRCAGGSHFVPDAKIW
jgi:hypothetical protein